MEQLFHDDIPRTSLSAGEVLAGMLLADERFTDTVRDLFPCVRPGSPQALPYVVYRRYGHEQTPVSLGRPADLLTVEVLCYASTYGQMVMMTELVRDILDGRTYDLDGLRMRSCNLADIEDSWADDAFEGRMVFELRI